MTGAIRIRSAVEAEIIEHGLRDSQLECCGLLAGSGGVISKAFPATNAAEDPAKNYEIAPEELFRLMREIRAAALAFMGVYHSHPNGCNEPSPRDIELAYYPEVAYFILSPQENSERVRAFAIRNGRVDELQIVTE